MKSDGFSRGVNFKATKDVYGVDPMEFADLPYREAAVIMYIHAKREYQRVCDEYFSLPLTKEYYEQSVFLAQEMKKFTKSVELASIRLREIGIDSSSIDWREEDE